jgi:CheY-like chemotaxis protein
MRLLIVEDQPNDLRVAAKVAEGCGFSEVEGRSSSVMARTHLEKALAGEHPLPDAILLDLDLGHDSGFELLRFWHSEPRLSAIPLVVWSILGDQYGEICRMFKVNAYINKGDDVSHLRSVLSRLSA